MRYKIGSFNMNKFGNSELKDLDKIANIILGEDLDIVALQEVYSNAEGIENLINYSFPSNWKFCHAAPPKSSDPFKNANSESEDILNNEEYVFMWDTRKFKLVEFSENGGRESFERIISYDDVYEDCSFFARTPYYVRLEPQSDENFELRLINVHIYFGKGSESMLIDKRKEEFKFLTEKLFKHINMQQYGDFRPAFTIAMGDYNLNISKKNGHLVVPESLSATVDASYFDEENRIHVQTDQDLLTTLRKKELSEDQKRLGSSTRYANSYDHFTYGEERFDVNQPICKPIYAIENYCDGDFSYYQKNISDHLPVVMEFEIN